LRSPWTARPQATAAINGLVKAQDGAPVPGAILSYGRLAPAAGPHSAPAVLPPVKTVTTSANGSFSIQNLAGASYLVCAQTSDGAYLDPCHWSASPPTFTVAAGQTINGAVIDIPKGQQVSIAITGSQNTFASEGATPSARLMLGVVAVSGAFHPARLWATTAAGRTYTVTVPFDSPTRFFISPGSFQLFDDSGLAVAKAGKSVTITAPSTGAPPSLSYSLRGVGAR
jgi:hypothetical protein